MRKNARTRQVRQTAQREITGGRNLKKEMTAQRAHETWSNHPMGGQGEKTRVPTLQKEFGS